MKNIRHIASKFLILIIFLEAAYLFLPSFRTQEKYTSGKQKLAACKNLDNSGLKIQCAEKAVEKIIQKDGIDAGLESLAQISEMEVNFVDSCHSFAHMIGQTAYKFFKGKQDFKISPKITYCNYGFYHGFMETLLLDSGDYQKARDFCSYINNQLVEQGLDLAGECYHGIGHGTIDQHDTKQWSNPTLATEQAMKICNLLATDDRHLVDCASGVFNGVANFYAAGTYNLKIDEDKPFWLCDLQEERVKKTCYAFMARTLFPLTNSDLNQAINLATKTAPANYLGTVISNLTVLKPNPDSATWQEIINICRSVTQTAIKECLRGYAIGLLQSGQPGKEYQTPINFCESDLLTLDEKQMCFENILTQLKNYYPKDKLESICQSVDSLYRHLCT